MQYITKFNERECAKAYLANYANSFKDSSDISFKDKIRDCTALAEKTNTCFITVDNKVYTPFAVNVSYEVTDNNEYTMFYVMTTPWTQYKHLFSYSYKVTYADIMQISLKAIVQLLINFEYVTKLYHNCAVLTDYVNKLLSENEVSSTFEFAPGDKLSIFNLENYHLGIYLKAEIVEKLKSIMTVNSELQENNLKENILNTFENLPCVIEAVRRRTKFSENLGFYTWRKAKTLFRETYHRQAQNIHNGFGYILTNDNRYILVYNCTCNDSELEALKEKYKGYQIVERYNSNPCSADYYIAKDQEMLNMYITRYERSNRRYKVEQLADKNGKLYYRIIHKLNNVSIIVFNGINFDTYERGNITVDKSLLEY